MHEDTLKVRFDVIADPNLRPWDKHAIWLMDSVAGAVCYIRPNPDPNTQIRARQLLMMIQRHQAVRRLMRETRNVANVRATFPEQIGRIAAEITRLRKLGLYVFYRPSSTESAIDLCIVPDADYRPPEEG